MQFITYMKYDIKYHIEDAVTGVGLYEGTYQSPLVPRIGENLTIEVFDADGNGEYITAQVDSIFHHTGLLDYDVMLYLKTYV